MRLHIIAALGASLFATAGVNADSANLAGAFDLKGCQVKCAPGAEACLTYCQAQHDCWTKHSQQSSDLTLCLDQSQRAYDLAQQGASTGGASANADASGEKSVVTEAAHATVEDMNRKGQQDSN